MTPSVIERKTSDAARAHGRLRRRAASDGGSQQLIGLALVPASAVALTWATLDGERVWPLAVLSWIVGLWVSATRVRRDEHGGV